MRFPYETKVLRGLRGEQGAWDDERRFIAEAGDSKFDGTKFVQEAAAVQECAPPRCCPDASFEPRQPCQYVVLNK